MPNPPSHPKNDQQNKQTNTSRQKAHRYGGKKVVYTMQTKNLSSINF